MSVSGLPKLADFQKAIAAVKAANTKYTTAQNSLKPSQEAIDKAKSALDSAKDKLNSLQSDYNNKAYLNNSTYQNAYNTYQDALSKASSLENYWRSRDWLKSDSGYQSATNAYNTAQQKVQSLQDYINSGKYLQDNSAYQTAVNNQKAAQDKLNTAKNYLDSEDYLNKNSTYQNYVSAFNTADQKLNQLRDWKDSGRYLQENSTYQNALNAIPAKEDALRAAESKLDNWTGARSGTAWNSAVSAKVAADNAFIAAQAARDKAAEAASNAADTLIKNQDTIRSTAESNVNKTRDSLRQTAENAVNTAQSAYEAAQPAIDKAQQAAQTLAQSNLDAANKAFDTASTNKNIAENKADELAWTNWQTASKAADTYKGKADTIANGLESVANKALDTQKAAVDSQNGIFETAQNKYNDILNEIKPDLEDYNAKLADVSNYAQVFKDNIGDITSSADATAAKNLLTQFNTEIKNSGIQELQDKVAPLFSSIDPTKQVTPLALKGANVAYFPNIDSATGLPILNQTALDSLLNKYGGNSLNSSQYRENYDKFGWNVMSDNSGVLHGSDIFGVKKVTNPMGGYVSYQGDMNAAAKQLGIDISGLKTDAEKYKAINDASKDYYLVSNALDRSNVGADQPTAHASVLFKADGSGNLIPVVDQSGNIVSNQYQATVVHHGGWQEQLSELAPLIQMASLAFAPQLGGMLQNAIGAMEVSAAVAPTAFTAGLPAVTLAQTIGATGVSMIAGAVQNAVTSGLMGGDVAQAAITGAVSPAMSGNANQILDRVGISQDSINKIAEASNLQPQQVTNMIANGLTIGVTGVALGDPNALDKAITSVAGQFVGSEAQNLVADTMKGADPKVIAAASNAAGNVANVATQTTINGGDVSAALQNAMPSIIGSASKASDAVGKVTTPVTIEERSTYPEPTPDKYQQILDAFGAPVSQGVGTQVGPEYAALSPANQERLLKLGELFSNADEQTYLENAKSWNDELNQIVEDEIALGEQGNLKPNGDGTYTNITTGQLVSKDVNGNWLATTKSIGSLFSQGTPPPENVATKISLSGTGSTSTIDGGFGFIAQDFGTPEEKQKAVSDVETWQKQIQDDPQSSDAQKAQAAEIAKAIQNAVVTQPPEVKPPEVTPPVTKPTETAPTETKTTTTAGGSEAAAAPTPQQQADELQKKADAAQSEALKAINNNIQNPTPENKAIANKYLLDVEIAIKMANAAKANITGGDLTQSNVAPSTDQSEAQAQQQSQQQSQASQQTSQTTSALPGSGTSNLPGDSTTTGLGGTGTGDTGTSGIGTSGTGTGTGTGTDISGILSSIANALGGVKVPTVAGGLASAPVGYTTTTTPLAKRPIGDLYPVSNIMMTPEEIAARSTTKMVRRGGLVSIR